MNGNTTATDISASQLVRIEERYIQRFRSFTNTKPISTKQVSSGMIRLYRLANLEAPRIVKCNGPVDAVLCATLLYLAIATDMSCSFKKVGKALESAGELELAAALKPVLNAPNFAFLQLHLPKLKRFDQPSALRMWMLESELFAACEVNLMRMLHVPRTAQLRRANSPQPTDADRPRFLALETRACLRTKQSLMAKRVSLILDKAGRTFSADLLEKTIRPFIEYLMWTHWENRWVQYYLAVRDVLGPEAVGAELSALLDTMEMAWINNCATLFLPGLCVVGERPNSISIDEQMRLHNASTEAIRFADGFTFYSWHGALIPEHAILEPDKLTPQIIIDEPNVASRRALVDIFGAEKFATGYGTIISTDEFGVLYKMELPGDEQIMIVRVVNSSPEPDGTYKNYYLRVPPHISTPREAVSWTFDMDANTYSPKVQT